MIEIKSAITPARAGLRALLTRLIPLWCVALALMLTPPGAFVRDLWTDEAYTLSYMTHPDLGAVLADVRKNEETPPLPFVLAWLWARVFGPSAMSIRLLSLLYGVLAVGLIAELVRRWRSPAEALIAGALAAAVPLVGVYLFEARGYTLALLLAALCVACFERLRRPAASMWLAVGYGLSAAALMLTSYLGLALVLAHTVAWGIDMLRRPPDLRRRAGLWAMAQGVAAGPVLLWLPVLLGRMAIVSALSPYKDAQPIHYLWLGFGLLMHAPNDSEWQLVWLITSALLWGLAIYGLLRGREGAGLALRTFLLPALSLQVVLVVIGAIGSRYLITIVPGAALAVAVGWRAMHTLSPRLANAAIVLVLALVVAYRIPALVQPQPAPEWAPLAAQVASRAEPSRDAVLLQPPFDQRVFEYYYHGAPLALLGARHYDDFYVRDGHRLASTWTVDEARAAARGHERLWVFYNTRYSSLSRLELPYRQLGAWQLGRLELRLYDTTQR